MNKKILFLIITLLVLFLVSCNKTTIKNNISYNTDLKTYSISTKTSLKNEINLVLYNSLNKKISSGTISELTDTVYSTFINLNKSEYDLISFKDYLKTIENVNILSNKEVTSELFNQIINIFGTEGLSDLFYNLILYFYDYKIDRYEENIKELPKLKDTYQAKINELKKDKDIFLMIDKTMFENLVKGLYIIKNVLASSSSFNDDSLSNEEIKTFISKIDLKISFSEDEYKVFFNLLSNFSDYKDLTNHIINNNDQYKIGLTLNNIFSLIDSIFKNIKIDAIDSFKNSNKDDFVKDIFINLNEDEENIFKEIISNKLDSYYLDYLDDYLDVNAIKNTTNLDSNAFLENKSDINYNRLLMVIRSVFYD